MSLRLEDLPVELLRELVARVRQAVDYSPRDGVTCPLCRTGRRPGQDMGVIKTMAWHGSLRERYHACRVCGHRFKSVQSC
ncbi:hypothetical protein [Desulfocurvibacter africanus]|uniref:Uncharacterized protein n=1 Tax=Desulfocurvibacter africanus subsp. africanus str. Walvis Bay TaxID=690850 RepID=F3YXK9_DESAF|nr:hypothetical protein [Desulfocurvibacter africanus]EGJ51786.1 hypothetical protein Desaf_3502 [Desulfocurvibacter africanus subsp. africanus str. Walvis Bay]